jgi:predicted nucleic acid-binding protein
VAESDTAKAVRLRDDFRAGAVELLAPDFFPTEVASAILIAERRGRVAPGDGPKLLIDVLNTLPFLHPVLPDLLPRAYANAALTRSTVYDCLYVALAEREGCELITADDRLVRNLQPQFSFLVPLASLP